MAVFAVHFLDRQVLAILIPPIKSELHLSDTALGLLSGLAFTILFSTAGLIIGRLADRTNRARIITWSLAGFSAMTAMCGMATGFWQLLIARVGVGIGEGGTNPASHSLIADLFPTQQRAAAMATYGIGPHVGLVLAFALGGWLGQTVGWRATFMIVGAIGLALALITGVGLRDPRMVTRSSGGMPSPAAWAIVRALFRSRALRHLFAAGTLATAAALGLITWLPALLTREYGMSLGETGVALALAFGVGGAMGTYLFGRFVDIAGNVAVMRKPRMLVGCQDVVDPRARAFSAAVLLLIVNLVGASIGPLTVGVLSDALQTSTAASQSLRYALLAMPGVLAWSALHYARSMSGLTTELRK
jgi:predicted MFS family arabinose efflux permease